MKTRLYYIFIIMVAILLTASQSDSDSKILKGTIKGKVIDAESKTPIHETRVIVIGTQFIAAADSAGEFSIANVPVGSYTLRFIRAGYETLSQTDVIVKPRRITFVQAELTVAEVRIEEITVTAGYFSRTEVQPTSVTNFSTEEIRRAPGAAGDVSRIIGGLPSIARTDDTENSLVVRGGNPFENGFILDNIEIPNINHFPAQGSSGGPIGMVNVDFIRDVEFYTGGFSAAYGDKLSSIMNMTFREGNSDEFDGQLDIGFAGFGAIVEGPIPKEKGSFMFSARKSFLDLIVEAMDEEASVPNYSDYQGKLVYNITPNNKIMVLNILGVDSISENEADDMTYGDYAATINTLGVNWQYLWSESGYSNTSVSHTFTKYDVNHFETRTDKELMDNNTLEQAFRLRNTNYYRFNEYNQLQFGVCAEHSITEYDKFLGEYTDALGGSTPEFYMDDEISADKLGIYASYIWKPIHKLTTTLGVRTDYFSYNEAVHISPRLSASYSLTNKTAISGSTGVFYQELPLVLLLQTEENRDLKAPVAYHYVVSLKHLLTENTQLTLEAYQKDYDHFPLEPSTPSLFIIDEHAYRYGFFFNHEGLVDSGKARSRGVELMIQKKLAKDFYGLVSGAYSRVKYQDYNDVWRDRVFDNRYNFSVGGGYRPNKVWEFSMRWIYAGGRPYTPFDIAASESINRGVLDQNNINGERYPDYHSLNIRFDRRFYFRNSNLIFYLDIWNAYNRENVSAYNWDESKNKPVTFHQWSLMPIFGLEYEF